MNTGKLKVLSFILATLFVCGPISAQEKITDDFLKDIEGPAKRTVPVATPPSKEVLEAGRAAREVAERAQFEMIKSDPKLFKEEFDRELTWAKFNLQKLNKKKCD